MRLRQKLLILLLAAALIPAATVALMNRSLIQESVDLLTDSAAETVTNRLVADMRRVVAAQSGYLSGQQNLIETRLRLLGAEVRDRLAEMPFLPGAFAYGLRDRDGKAPLFHLAPDAETRDATRAAQALKSLDRVFDAMSTGRTGGMPVLYTVTLATGLHVVWPTSRPLPKEYDPRTRPWYLRALSVQAVQWTPIVVDKELQTLAAVASAPILGEDGEVLGAIAAHLSIEEILALPERESLPEGADALMVAVAEDDRGRRRLVRVLQQESGAPNWSEPVAPKYLDAGSQAANAELATAIQGGQTGVVRAAWLGEPAVWAYSPIDGQSTALVIVAPVRGIDKAAGEVQQLIRDLALRQVQWAAGALLIIAALAVAAAFLLAGRISLPVQRLAAAATRLARGDFTVRAEVDGKDEIGDLARGFNQMVPALGELVEVRRSLALAEDVQKNLLPDAAPSLAGFDLAGRAVYCDETGGDYFDFVPLVGAGADERPEKIGVVVGDVSGHGIAAALLMTSARALLRGRARGRGSPGELLAHVNGCLSDDVTRGHFMTLYFVELTAGSRRLRITNAGHGPAFLYDPQKGSVSEIGGGDGPPLGVVGDIDYDTETLNVVPGQVLVAATDGLWEAENPSGEAFGRDRLKAAIAELSAASAQDVVDGLCARVDAFADGCARRDDVTVVAIKVV